MSLPNAASEGLHSDLFHHARADTLVQYFPSVEEQVGRAVEPGGNGYFPCPLPVVPVSVHEKQPVPKF